MKTDILVAGCGCSGLYLALHLPKEKQVLIVTKEDAISNDSYLAQGGMCVLTDPSDYDAYYEDTMAAGHYENDPQSVAIMIRSSQDVLKDLVAWDVDFKRDEGGELLYTREGAHSASRIVFHEDITGQEITSHLLDEAKKRRNITLMEHTTLLDILSEENVCYGGILRLADGTIESVAAEQVVLATGGVGGVYRHSTNFRHLTGDGLAIALKHGVALKDSTYVQIHPTTFFTKDREQRSFLISESMRGEGAKLYDKNGERFVDELLPRDRLSEAILTQMEKDGTEYVWEDLSQIPREELDSHFPNIVDHCRQMGYDVYRECIPVVPAQHYFMGGIKVDHESRTTMENLYAVGETACNGVHGKNRLASNSLLESLVFAKRAAKDIAEKQTVFSKDRAAGLMENVSLDSYKDKERLEQEYKELVCQALGIE